MFTVFNTPKKIIKGTVLLLFSLFIVTTSCKKLDGDAEPATNYDTANRIMRIDAKSKNNIPYTITIKQTSANGAVDLQQVQQNTGAAFNYYFTPTIGRQITIRAESNTADASAITLNINYKGQYAWPVTMKSDGNSGIYGEFNYTVTE